MFTLFLQSGAPMEPFICTFLFFYKVVVPTEPLLPIIIFYKNTTPNYQLHYLFLFPYTCYLPHWGIPFITNKICKIAP